MQPTHPHNPTTAAGGSELRKTRRRRRRRRGRNALQSLRVALVLSGGVAAAYLLFALLNKAAHPYLLRYETRRQVRTARAELARRRAINEELTRRIEYLKSDEGAESEARRLGHYRKGETVYLLRTDEHEAAAAGTPDAATAEQRPR